MADELNGQALPFTIQIFKKITILKMMALHGTLPVTMQIGPLTKLGLLFLVVCFIHVFEQTLAEQLYRDKGYGWSTEVLNKELI